MFLFMSFLSSNLVRCYIIVRFCFENYICFHQRSLCPCCEGERDGRGSVLCVVIA